MCSGVACVFATICSPQCNYVAAVPFGVCDLRTNPHVTPVSFGRKNWHDEEEAEAVLKVHHPWDEENKWNHRSGNIDCDLVRFIGSCLDSPEGRLDVHNYRIYLFIYLGSSLWVSVNHAWHARKLTTACSKTRQSRMRCFADATTTWSNV